MGEGSDRVRVEGGSTATDTARRSITVTIVDDFDERV